MNKELPKVYEPQQVESRIYQMWEDHGCFKGVEDSKKKPFLHRHAAPQRHRPASHGPRPGLHAAGHPDPL